MTKVYAVKEVFATLQGEGYWSGTAAVFVRFVGCNLWSGRDEDRAEDAKRNKAACPTWCDTDFRSGESMTAEKLAERICDAQVGAGMGVDSSLIVFTGGEPMLQLNYPLLDAVRQECRKRDKDSQAPMLAIETNGTVEIPRMVVERLSWVCVSPKTPPESIVVREGDELKVVFPSCDPMVYDDAIGDGFEHFYVSAEAATSAVGESVIVRDNLKRAAEFCMKHPWWHLTLQLHKIVGLP